MTRPTLKRRSSGVLLHPASLPGPAAGRFAAALDFVDFLARSKQSWWQMLPVCPPDETGSPYASPSAFAGEPSLLGVEGDAGPSVRERADFDAFRARESSWLEDYALFAALKDAHRGRPWTDWDEPLCRREADALEQARRGLEEPIRRHLHAQWRFSRRWTELRARAAERGVGLLGDAPIYMCHDSADVWAHQELFLLDAAGRSTAVAGVPPDYFSATGQLWGNPLYRWEQHLKTGFAWWLARLKVCAERFDAVRLDHFIGFRNYWEIPAGEKTAINGRWVNVPGDEFFAAVRRAVPGLELLAENLGCVTPAVEALREAFGLPGMRVAQFSFGGPESDLPAHWPENCAGYTGTHDNDTTRGWWEDAGHDPGRRDAADREREAFRRASGGEAPPSWAMLRLVWSSPAHVVFAPAQDLLDLPGSARMNKPGTVEGNWRWKLAPGALDANLAVRLAEITSSTGRAPEKPS